MQRLTSLVKTITSFTSTAIPHSLVQKSAVIRNLLPVFTPLANPSNGFKVRGVVKRRCKHCYIVVRDNRIYNICPKSPRHKTMSMKPKPLTTYILTHATQSKVRPW